MLTSTPKTILLKDYTPPAFLVSSIDLDVDLRDDHALVKAKLAVTRNPVSADPKAPLKLDGDELELVSVALNGRVLANGEFIVSGEHLEIPGVPERFILETAVRIRPKQNTRLMGLYASKDGY